MMHWHWHEYKGNKDKRKKVYWGEPTRMAALFVVALILLVALESSTGGQQNRELAKSGQLRNVKRQTSFDQLVHTSYSISSTPKSTKRRVFKLSRWKQNKPNGGLQNDDFILLAKFYSKADSVFEFGIGESTLLANHLGLPRYVGLDSDPSYITIIREKVSSHFRFMWADIGNTDAIGRPDDKLLPKNVYSYQIAPLMTEYKAFDVYMVNGSWRLPCMLASFLHASARKMEAKGLTLPLDQISDTNTIIVVRDCLQKERYPSRLADSRTRNLESYHAVDRLLDLVDQSGQRMCVYKRKSTTSDQDLLDMWMKNYNETG